MTRLSDGPFGPNGKTLSELSNDELADECERRLGPMEKPRTPRPVRGCDSTSPTSSSAPAPRGQTSSGRTNAFAIATTRTSTKGIQSDTRPRSNSRSRSTRAYEALRGYFEREPS